MFETFRKYGKTAIGRTNIEIYILYQLFFLPGG